jgi:peptide-methionine (S)-S-oxide reductase
MTTTSIGLGGGCHWCTEAVFQSLRGVTTVSQGFIASTAPHSSFSEAVIVEFDSTAISLAVLIEVHLRTHASTSNHKLRGKYRSAIYTYSDDQRTLAQSVLVDLQSGFDKPLVTHVMSFADFKASDDRFVNYREKNPNGQFCKRFIDPKLKQISEQFGRWADDSVNEPLDT